MGHVGVCAGVSGKGRGVVCCQTRNGGGVRRSFHGHMHVCVGVCVCVSVCVCDVCARTLVCTAVGLLGNQVSLTSDSGVCVRVCLYVSACAHVGVYACVFMFRRETAPSKPATGSSTHAVESTCVSLCRIGVSMCATHVCVCVCVCFSLRHPVW